jgi:hypothetical protein
MERLLLFLIPLFFFASSCKVRPPIDQEEVKVTSTDEDSYEEGLPISNNLLLNGSFEDGEPGLSKVPDYWETCGYTGQSPGDLHENGAGYFDVTQKAVSATQFVGMVVRSDGTKECLQQELISPIAPGFYELELTLSKSAFYVSIDRITKTDANYSTPVLLEIIGLTEDGAETVLFSTAEITSTEWIKIEELISVEERLIGIKIAPNFSGDDFYNGNILIDKIIFSLI